MNVLQQLKNKIICIHILKSLYIMLLLLFYTINCYYYYLHYSTKKRRINLIASNYGVFFDFEQTDTLNY